MNTAYCRDCREFVTTEERDWLDPKTMEEGIETCCSGCHSNDLVQAEDVIDAAEHMLGRRGEDV